MTTFDQSFDDLMGNEGGYSNHPEDRGGETMWGITERVARENGYLGAMRALPRATAKTIARKCYWDPAHCDELDPRVAFQVFDAIFNGGPAIKWLQQSVGAKPDGVIGPVTREALRQADPLKLMMRFNAYRMKYLASLKTWPTFGAGWATRIANNLLIGSE